jgi:outer membrane protein assembly factor BamB
MTRLAALLLLGMIAPASPAGDWPQWRGPARDGLAPGPDWPAKLDTLAPLWRVPFGPSYSGPVVAGDLVYTTETKDKKSEVVTALDRATGSVRWRAEWDGTMTVPFFAAANGSWVRSTPACDGESLYVAGMRDVLVCLDALTGKERWRVDFVKAGGELPAFGFVCSPLVDGDALYVQAGGAVVRLNKRTGDVLWKALESKDGMMGSAFSSPVVATIAGKRQLVAQTREKLAGVDLETGKVLWSQAVPAFRGMNILTPAVVGDAVFTASYQNKARLYKVSRDGDAWAVAEAWSSKDTGYMSSPVVVGGHAYLHLQNQRFGCLDLKTGATTWTSTPFGKYASLVAQGDRILALDQTGLLLLFKADPAEFELIDKKKVADAETWAHLAVAGDEVYVRELGALAAYRWKPAK